MVWNPAEPKAIIAANVLNKWEIDQVVILNCSLDSLNFSNALIIISREANLEMKSSSNIV